MPVRKIWKPSNACQPSNNCDTVEETVNDGNNFLSPQCLEKGRLNLLKDKNARYEPHNGFLLQCVQAGLIPKYLKLEGRTHHWKSELGVFRQLVYQSKGFFTNLDERYRQIL